MENAGKKTKSYTEEQRESPQSQIKAGRITSEPYLKMATRPDTAGPDWIEAVPGEKIKLIKYIAYMNVLKRVFAWS